MTSMSQASQKEIIALIGGCYYQSKCPRQSSGGNGFKSMQSFSERLALAMHCLSHVKPSSSNGVTRVRSAYEGTGTPEIEIRSYIGIHNDPLSQPPEGYLSIRDLEPVILFILIKENHSVTTEPPETAIEPRPAQATLELTDRTIQHVLEASKKADIDVILYSSSGIATRNDLLCAITHLITTEEDAENLWTTVIGRFSMNKLVDRYLQLGVKNVVIIRGHKGAFFSDTEGTMDRLDEAPLVKTKNTFGMIERFVAAYALMFQQGRDSCHTLQSIVNEALKTATWKPRTPSDNDDQLPYYDDVNE